MTPAARYAAAIGILDEVLGGARAEAALTRWARSARYAGAGDRAAVRDHVFEGLRRRRSLAALGGADTGRGIVLGLLRAEGRDPADVFTGACHAPARLRPEEAAHLARPPALTEAEALDCPDWLVTPLRDSLGADFGPVMRAMQARAPVFLRVNIARIAVGDAVARLAAEGILARPVPLASTALEVVAGARQIRRSAAWADGLVELQDAASQAVVEALPLRPGMRALDFCAGGGGKALALAARGAEVVAHDALPQRMKDLPVRAARAGARIVATEDPAAMGRFPLVLADVPCSGSGTWRRDPDGKWRFGPSRLAVLRRTQDRILRSAAPLVAPGGVLAYVTCSMLREENEARVAAFRADHPGWSLALQRRWSPLDGADGFFLAMLRRD